MDLVFKNSKMTKFVIFYQRQLWNIFVTSDIALVEINKKSIFNKNYLKGLIKSQPDIWQFKNNTLSVNSM